MPKQQFQQIATQLETAFHRQGHPRVTVRVQRGHALVQIDGEVLARYTPGPNDDLHLSYRNHTGRWEPMPFAAQEPDEAVRIALEVLKPYFQAFTDF